MAGERFAPADIALLCRLYQLEPATAEGLIAPCEGRNDLQAALARQLAATSATEARERLERLRAARFVELRQEAWALTDPGRALAYEAGELQIQRLSGLWGRVADLLPAQPSFARVLDVGSGGGSAGLVMREAGLLAAEALYIGVDISHLALASGIELSHSSGADITTARLQGSVYQLPLGCGTVDCCVSRSTLYYLQKRRALAEMARVVKTGGCLIVLVPTIGYMMRRAVRGWSTLRLREAVKYTAATLLGAVAWLGVDVKPPRALFTGETKRGLRVQLSGVPGLRLVLLKQLTLPFVGRPLLLIAEKVG